MLVHGHFEEHSPRVLFSQHHFPLQHCSCAVRNAAWLGRETESRPLAPHSQKRPEDHNETGRNELSGPNLGGPLPQERWDLCMAWSSGEVVRVPVRAENTRAKKHTHRSNFRLCSGTFLAFFWLKSQLPSTHQSWSRPCGWVQTWVVVPEWQGRSGVAPQPDLEHGSHVSVRLLTSINSSLVNVPCVPSPMLGGVGNKNEA